MKHSIAVLLFSLLAFAGQASANAEARKEAEIMLASLDIDTALAKSIEEMLSLQLAQKPALAPFKGVMLGFLKKYMSYDSLRDDLIDIYADAFTATELREINAFYRTPTGAKTIRIMPELMSRGGQLGAKRVQDNIVELQQMLAAEARRIKDRQGK